MMKKYRTDLDAIDTLADKWPSSMISRAELSKFSGGILNARTEANLESRKDENALNPFRIGKKVFYTVPDVIQTIKRRMAPR